MVLAGVKFLGSYPVFGQRAPSAKEIAAAWAKPTPGSLPTLRPHVQR